MIERRVFISAASVLMAPHIARAQQARKQSRVGLLTLSAKTAGTATPGFQALVQGLRDLGYVEGQNLKLEYRSAEGRRDTLLLFARELASLNLDVIKRLELVRILVLKASRIGILWDERNPGSRLAADETAAAAGMTGLTMDTVPVRSATALEAAFATLVRHRSGAVDIIPSPMFFSHRQRLADLAIKHRLPTVVGSREYVEAGGLASYGADYPDLFRHAGTFVDRILKGTRPGDLPIEQPTKFELVINLNTARTIGLTIPPSLLSRADEVIQ